MVPKKVSTCFAEVFDKTDINPYLIGDRGMGKTAIYAEVRAEWAKKLLSSGKIDSEDDVELRYIYTAQMADGGDLLGLPDKKDGITTFARNELFPTNEDVLIGRAKPYGILVFDEPNRGTRETIQALFQILVSKELGPHKLADNWRVGLAGNPDTGDYIVNTMDEAFWDRVMLIRFENTTLDWVRYAKRKGLDSTLTSFVELQGGDQLRKGVGGSNFKLPVKPSYRSLEKASMVLSNCNFDDEAVLEECLQGLLGVETTIALLAFMKNNKRTPLTASDVLEHWGEHKARWEAIVQGGDVDLRQASIDNVLSALDMEADPEDSYWDGKWSAQSLFEMLSTLPHDVLISVIHSLLQLASKDSGGSMARWFLANKESVGKGLIRIVADMSTSS